MMYPWVHSAEVPVQYICRRSEPLLKFSIAGQTSTPYYSDNYGTSHHQNPCRTSLSILLFLRYGGGYALLRLPIGDSPNSTAHPRPTQPSPPKKPAENSADPACDTPRKW
ncbi:MAG: hypothetical protein IT211_00355 [Armatimonadetes bacterium]|nr:hypothetical protein [Armatimonadota bacterium]